MELCKYQQVPSNIQEEIIEAKRKADLVASK
jgi:elongation factor G